MIYYEYSGVFKAINSTVDGILSLGELLDMAGRLELFLTEEEGSRIFSLMDIDCDEKVRIMILFVMSFCVVYLYIYLYVPCRMTVIVLSLYTWLYSRIILLQSFLSTLKGLFIYLITITTLSCLASSPHFYQCQILAFLFIYTFSALFSHSLGSHLFLTLLHLF